MEASKTIGGIVTVKKERKPYGIYETPELRLIIIREDIVTLSGSQDGEGELGSDLGGGQIGGGDIFD